MGSKSGKDAVFLVYTGKKDEEREDAAPATVRFFHNEHPYTLKKGEKVKHFNRAEALSIIDNANTWKVNAVLEIQEIDGGANEEDEDEEEEGDGIENMTKKKLMEIADAEGVEYQPAMKKEEILAAIKAKRG